MRLFSFVTWASRKLATLIFRGVGRVSSVVTVILFVLPSIGSGFSRWWALLPITVYVLGALLWDEYQRVSKPCLTAQAIRGSGKVPRTILEIRNCGPVTIEQVGCDLPPNTWEVYTDGIEYPIERLEPNEPAQIPLVITMASPAQARVTLRGVVDGAPYEKEKLLTVPFV